jgi:MarR family 2-MHQ and catechol resistance regulon transcriptional repressor
VSEDRREAFYRERMRQHGPRYPEFDLLATETAVSLLYTYDLFHQTVSRYLAEFGLSKSTFNILMVLWHAKPEGVFLHDLGELLLVSRANITGLVDHLEEKGYVKRVVAAEDKETLIALLKKMRSSLRNHVPESSDYAAEGSRATER